MVLRLVSADDKAAVTEEFKNVTAVLTRWAEMADMAESAVMALSIASVYAAPKATLKAGDSAAD